MSRVERSAYRQFRAPRADGQSFVDPLWQDLPGLVAANRTRIAGLRYDFAGLPLLELRQAARSYLLQVAEGEPVTDALERPLVMSGHQPELYHPGVWFKNFVLDRLAKEVSGRAVNLTIDSDLCRAPSVNVPTGDAAAPRVEAVTYDTAAAPLPYEQRGVIHQPTLQSFPARVQQALAGWVEQPLVAKLWPRVLDAVQADGNLGAAFCAARHSVEREWGLNTAEAPISAVCDSAPFHCFALDLLHRLTDFHTAHNRALAEYRTAHKIRTPAQPIPDLHHQRGWLEAPFWVWTVDDPTRRPLFARPRGDGLLLSDLAGGEWPLPSPTSAAAASEFATLRSEHGVKIRSRALVTTLFARLLLADVFIHGIGGAKYDQVTDRMAELFYGFAPPPHVTATATLRLPIPHENANRRPAEITSELRVLEYHPEQRLDASALNSQQHAEAQQHVDAKLRWVQTAKTPANAAQRHQAIAAANAALQQWVEPQRAALLEEQQRAAQQVRAAAVLESREYSFCLFPAEWLRSQLTALLPPPAP